MTLSILSISSQLSFADTKRDLILGTAEGIPAGLGAATGSALSGPPGRLIGGAIGTGIGYALQKAREKVEHQIQTRKYRCIENPYLIRCANEDEFE